MGDREEAEHDDWEAQSTRGEETRRTEEALMTGNDKLVRREKEQVRRSRS